MLSNSKPRPVQGGISVVLGMAHFVSLLLGCVGHTLMNNICRQQNGKHLGDPESQLMLLIKINLAIHNALWATLDFIINPSDILSCKSQAQELYA